MFTNILIVLDKVEENDEKLLERAVIRGSNRTRPASLMMMQTTSNECPHCSDKLSLFELTEDEKSRIRLGLLKIIESLSPLQLKYMQVTMW
jgi:hypothetical protein